MGLNSLHIFDLVIDYMGKVSLKVMLDMHRVNPDQKEPLWYNRSYSYQTFKECWKWLVNRVKTKDIMIAVDLLNEPHGTPFKEPGEIWDSSTSANNWKQAAQETAQEVLAINPELLVMVEGIESYPKPGYTFASTDTDDYYTDWWGGKMDGTDHPNNVKWMTALRDFIVGKRIHFPFWCLNDNSGDTGGIYVNNFEGIDTEKYNLLKAALWKDNNGKFIGLDHQLILNSLDTSYVQNSTDVTLATGGTLEPPPATPTPTPVPVSPYFGNLQVHYRCGDTAASSSQVKPYLMMVNKTRDTINLADVKIVYYYTKEGTVPEQYAVDYAPKITVGNITITFFPAYFELTFASGAGTVTAGSDCGEIQVRINRADYSNYNQTDDYSFSAAATAYTAYDKIIFYHKNQLAWGVLPGGNPTIPPATPTPTPANSCTTTPQQTGITLGDVNNNSSIDIIDALMTAQYYVGLLTTLDC